MYDDDPPEPRGAVDDERLRLVFTCCHPALAMETRVALTMRMVGGLTVPEIARAFLVQESAMARSGPSLPSCRIHTLLRRRPNVLECDPATVSDRG